MRRTRETVRIPKRSDAGSRQERMDLVGFYKNRQFKYEQRTPDRPAMLGEDTLDVLVLDLTKHPSYKPRIRLTSQDSPMKSA